MSSVRRMQSLVFVFFCVLLAPAKFGDAAPPPVLICVADNATVPAVATSAASVDAFACTASSTIVVSVGTWTVPGTFFRLRNSTFPGPLHFLHVLGADSEAAAATLPPAEVVVAYNQLANNGAIKVEGTFSNGSSIEIFGNRVIAAGNTALGTTSSPTALILLRVQLLEDVVLAITDNYFEALNTGVVIWTCMVHWVVAKGTRAVFVLDRNTIYLDKTANGAFVGMIYTHKSEYYLAGSSVGPFAAGFHAIGPNTIVSFAGNTVTMKGPSPGLEAVHAIVLAAVTSVGSNSTLSMSANAISMPASHSLPSNNQNKYALGLVYVEVGGDCHSRVLINDNIVTLDAGTTTLEPFAISLLSTNFSGRGGTIDVSRNHISLLGTAVGWAMTLYAVTLRHSGLLRVTDNTFSTSNASQSRPLIVVGGGGPLGVGPTTITDGGQLIVARNSVTAPVAMTASPPLVAITGATSTAGLPNDVQLLANVYYGTLVASAAEIAVAYALGPLSGTAVTMAASDAGLFIRRAVDTCRTQSSTISRTSSFRTVTGSRSLHGDSRSSTRTISGETPTPKTPTGAATTSAGPAVTPTKTHSMTAGMPTVSVAATPTISPAAHASVTNAATRSYSATRHSVTPSISDVMPTTSVAVLSSVSPAAYASVSVAATPTPTPHRAKTQSAVAKSLSQQQRTLTARFDVPPLPTASRTTEWTQRAVNSSGCPTAPLTLATSAVRVAGSTSLRWSLPVRLPLPAADMIDSTVRFPITFVCDNGAPLPSPISCARQDRELACSAGDHTPAGGVPCQAALPTCSAVLLRFVLIDGGVPALGAVAVIIVTAVGMSALSAVLVGDPTDVGIVVAVMVLAGPCSPGGDATAGRLAHFLVSPLHWLGPAPAAAVYAGTAALLVTGWLAVAFVCAHVTKVSLLTACGRLRFPSVPFAIVSAVYGAAAWEAGRMVGTADGPQRWGLVPATLLLLAVPAAHAWCITRWVPGLFRPAPAVPSRASLLPKLLRRSVLPTGFWVPSDAEQALGLVRGAAAPRGWLLMPGLCATVVAAAALVYSGGEGRTTTCRGRNIALAVLAAMVGAVVAALRPYRAHATTALTTLGLWIASVVAAVSALDTGDDTGNGAARRRAVLTAAIIVLSIGSILRCLHLCVLQFWWKQQQEAEEGGGLESPSNQHAALVDDSLQELSAAPTPQDGPPLEMKVLGVVKRDA